MIRPLTVSVVWFRRLEYGTSSSHFIIKRKDEETPATKSHFNLIHACLLTAFSTRGVFMGIFFKIKKLPRYEEAFRLPISLLHELLS